MRILEAFDLTKSYRDAGDLAGCDHKTVAHWVARRDAGELTATMEPRERFIDPYLEKLEEWMEHSKGKIPADVAHAKLVAMGYTGSERTTRRAVAEAREALAAGHRRVYRPWVTERGCGSSGTTATTGCGGPRQGVGSLCATSFVQGHAGPRRCCESG